MHLEFFFGVRFNEATRMLSGCEIVVEDGVVKLRLEKCPQHGIILSLCRSFHQHQGQSS